MYTLKDVYKLQKQENITYDEAKDYLESKEPKKEIPFFTSNDHHVKYTDWGFVG